MEGLHLTADCFDCKADTEFFLCQEQLSKLLTKITIEAGLTIVGQKYHSFSNPDGGAAGVTGTLLLAESHVAIHTWPEKNAVTLDVYVCNFHQDNSEKARYIVDSLIRHFQPDTVSRQQITRGQMTSATSGTETLSTERLSSSTFYSTRTTPLLQTRSQFQQIEIADSADFGKLMRIDGAMMTSEKDEFFYHESLIHPAAITHPAPRTALIIGGGDGGSCRELLKHPSLETLTLCEIDPAVVSISREYLPEIHQGSLDHVKVRHIHADGFTYIRECGELYDLIFLDLTDPQAPDGSTLAATCITEEFFQTCAAKLKDNGMLVMHLGSPYYHPQRYCDTLRKLFVSFPVVRPYSVFIPLYGALWGMAIASKSIDPTALGASTVKQRIEHRQLKLLKYYNDEVHHALFVLPNFMRKLMPTTS
ncbi:polyamine aminopropyltransferase [Undibacterium sp. 14-3-2]|uniref:polyamine aminopropyltransferase n=1 Tax=Undibacterium sp. 14-3-2 TaxID=2800129 RepID=UPI001907A98C|nr:polyamine aminopropyltransferase [Undibacterium sp. 14-3-2]MBK1889364.1 polyamine aminopropyltransferase [Undibacterium sp. 14-3-2]